MLGVLLAPVVAHVGFALLPGHASFVVASGSMEPAVERGSIVYVSDTGAYATGDVIAFARADRIVTHRVVERTAAGYVTKGDANSEPDGRPVPEDRVVGEVVASATAYGSLLSVAQSTPGRVAMVVLPSVVLLVSELRRLRRIW